VSSLQEAPYDPVLAREPQRCPWRSSSGFSFDKEKMGSLGGSCFEPSPVLKTSDSVPEPPASVGTGTASAEGAERGVASSPPVGMVDSLAMATVASFVCSGAIVGVPLWGMTNACAGMLMRPDQQPGSSLLGWPPLGEAPSRSL
jgi:hypothetical protein